MTDLTGHATFVNKPLSNLLGTEKYIYFYNKKGYSPEEMKGKFLFEYVEEKSQSYLQQMLQGTQGAVDQCEFSFTQKNGKHIHCLVTLKRIT